MSKMIINAKFPSKCYETGMAIAKNEECMHDTVLKKVYHKDSVTFRTTFPEYSYSQEEAKKQGEHFVLIDEDSCYIHTHDYHWDDISEKWIINHPVSRTQPVTETTEWLNNKLKENEGTPESF